MYVVAVAANGAEGPPSATMSNTLSAAPTITVPQNGGSAGPLPFSISIGNTISGLYYQYSIWQLNEESLAWQSSYTTQTTVLVVRPDGTPVNLANGTSYKIYVDAFDNGGGASSATKQKSTSATFTYSTAVLPSTPATLQVARSGNTQTSPSNLGYYLSVNYALQPSTQSFKIYEKRPTDTDFVAYTYNAQIPANASILPLPVGDTPNFYHRYETEWQWWRHVQAPSSELPTGLYRFYVTAVDTSGAESAATPTVSFTLYGAPGIVTPAHGSTTAVPFTITVSGDPSVASHE